MSLLAQQELEVPGAVWGGCGLDPVDVQIVRVCAFKAKPCGLCGLPKTNRVHSPKKTATCGFRRQNGCAACGKPKGHADHLGAPESFNVMAGRDPNVYRSAIERWGRVLKPLLEASGLPKGLERVVVEGQVSFGDATERDQGNHRVMIEKALGDALVSGGWLEKDTWSHYEFGGLARVERACVNGTFLTLFPSVAPVRA